MVIDRLQMLRAFIQFLLSQIQEQLSLSSSNSIFLCFPTHPDLLKCLLSLMLLCTIYGLSLMPATQIRVPASAYYKPQSNLLLPYPDYCNICRSVCSPLQLTLSMPSLRDRIRPAFHNRFGLFQAALSPDETAYISSWNLINCFTNWYISCSFNRFLQFNQPIGLSWQ